jgi:(2Fe-2S) ferredoxin
VWDGTRREPSTWAIHGKGWTLRLFPPITTISLFAHTTNVILGVDTADLGYEFPQTHLITLRNSRCVLAERFLAEIRRRGISQARVFLTSHLGGHKFAGNVVVQPAGDWYGYVTPDDVVRLLEHSITHTNLALSGQLGVERPPPLNLHDLWRGRMGM